ncbi:hypothetical protein LX95_02396 [Mesonia algae]|uniref:Uncharacterized protein n=1 Tax=Mesonia algae TaxID=213248 RepID=A0A2W7HXP5_9FLAO|nr:hypothetical protein [Mesonia algae]PZW39254.1 hypothetical protein LX95_02396 [Mesonia algae]
MPKSNFQLFSVIFILTGGGMLIYDMIQEKDLIYLKILGIIFLMLGLYLLNTKIRSKEDKTEEND